MLSTKTLLNILFYRYLVSKNNILLIYLLDLNKLYKYPIKWVYRVISLYTEVHDGLLCTHGENIT